MIVFLRRPRIYTILAAPNFQLCTFATKGKKKKESIQSLQNKLSLTKSQLDKTKTKLANVQGELKNTKAKLQQAIDSQQKLKKIKAANALNASRIARGTEFLPYAYEEQKQHLNENFDQTCTCIALGPNDSIVSLYEDGKFGYAGAGGLPESLYNKLRGRQKGHPTPQFVSMGTDDRYYIQFSNGSSSWVGPESLTTQLQDKKETRKVRSVAFGEDYNAWFIVYTNGGWAYQGLSECHLPHIIEQRGKKANIDYVSLGPLGEYYMRETNGFQCWHDIDLVNIFSIDRILNENGVSSDQVKRMVFGPRSEFVIRYH